jgi:hypothetical protein
MRVSTRTRRPGAVVAFLVFALGLPGFALASVGHQALAAKVTVTFTDTKFVLSRGGVEAGTASFVVVNKGQKLHVLAIRGPGLGGVRTTKVAAGRSATLTVTLRTGAYMLSDPVGLGASTVRWLVVSPATVVRSTGTGSVVTTLPAPGGMDCD